MYRYDNSGVRRQDRLLDEERALSLIADAEYGVLSLVGGSPETNNNGNSSATDLPCETQNPIGCYGIPLNYCWDGENLWFHCAPEGEKLKHIASHPDVCFTIVGRTAVQPSKFSTAYESVLIFGRISIVSDDAERMKALELFLKKYSPDHLETGLMYAQKSFARTTILKLQAHKITGKCKNYGF